MCVCTCVSGHWRFTGSEVSRSHLSGFTALNVCSGAEGSRLNCCSALGGGGRLKPKILEGKMTNGGLG